MITIKDFMETVNYRVTEGSDYCWNCYGENAYRLDYWNQDHEGHTVSIVFDTRTHEVYEANAYDYKRERAYRLINPAYKQAHNDEADDRGVLGNQAWDDVNYIDLETEEDFLDKAHAIITNKDYDTRVQIPLTLPDDQLFELMKLAHERDVTLNQMVEALLKDAIDNEEMLKDWVGQDTEMRDEYDFTEAVRGPVEKSIKKIKKAKKKGRM
jgi:hypothetical protein